MVVAVVDSGFHTHSDLWKNVFVNNGECGQCRNGLDDDGNGYKDDCHGWDFGNGHNNPFIGEKRHGTAVAGCLAARTNNGHGIAGVCPFCTIVPVKIYSESSGGYPASAKVEAYNYLLVMKIKISNHSYGGYGKREAENEALLALERAGHLFVTSAGNDNCNVDGDFCDIQKNGKTKRIDLKEKPSFPGAGPFSNILNVGSSNIKGNRSKFSNYGNKSVDLFAPGSNIVTLQPNNGYKYSDGTSYSSPLVAGVCAMLWGRNPSWTYVKVIEEVMRTVKQNPRLAGFSVSPGIVDMLAAVNSGSNTPNPWPPAEMPPGATLDPQPCYNLTEQPTDSPGAGQPTGSPGAGQPTDSPTAFV